MRSFGFLRRLSCTTIAHSRLSPRSKLLLSESCKKAYNSQAHPISQLGDAVTENRATQNGLLHGIKSHGRFMAGLNTISTKSLNLVMTPSRPSVNRSAKRMKGVIFDFVLPICSSMKSLPISFAARTACPLRHCRMTRYLRLMWSAGLLSVAIAGTDGQNGYYSTSVFRDLRANNGPRKIGIGWIPPSLHSVLAAILFLLSLCGSAIIILSYPQSLPWFVGGGILAFSTRPDLDSFLAWTRREAPRVAARKALLIDKLRAISTPFVITWIKRPDLTDYGLFSLVTLSDHADYIYIYAGVFSRWFLLGWYNLLDDYNFDYIDTITEGS